MPAITLPNNWRPRAYQRELWDYLERGGKRGVAVWHRRAGKDDLALHWTAVAQAQRVGTYWHLLPEATQARKAVWEAINPHTGRRRVDEAFPQAIRDTTRENEMMIRLKTGSTWQVVGSDNYNSLVGSPPVGVVFSEWALADPQAWAYIRPILAENGGWALFIYTPRGRNHGATTFENAKKTAGWFAQRLPATDTSVFTKEQLAQELAEYIADFGQDDGERRYKQEYLCDFDSGVVGSYYGREMFDAETQKRIGRVPWEVKVPVHTAWDLGIGDSTAIWFAQLVGREVRLIDYIENSGVGLDWYARQLRDRPYVYGDHLLPHDASVKELGSGKSRVETLDSLGLRNIVVSRARKKEDSINATRLMLPKCWFDGEKCAKGISALQNYRRQWDEKRKTFHDRPLHDWASHGADALTELAANEPAGGDVFERKLDYSMMDKGHV